VDALTEGVHLDPAHRSGPFHDLAICEAFIGACIANAGLADAAVRYATMLWKWLQVLVHVCV